MSSQSSKEDDGGRSVEDRKNAFSSAASDYFTTLSWIEVQLRRQIWALEEAGIIAAEASSQNAGNQGSLGSLDVGWLNSRNDKVGKEMEAELWAKARELIEGLDGQWSKGKNSEEATDSMEM